MFNKSSKKIRFLLEISSLYSYIFHRILVKIRTFFKLPPIYPYEEKYRYDLPTEKIVVDIQKAVPPQKRGDNPLFNKNWKSVFEREETAVEVSTAIRNITAETQFNPNPGHLTSLQTIGYTLLEDKRLGTGAVDQIVNYLDTQKVYPSHIAHFALEKPKHKEIVKQKHPFGSYNLETILKAPSVAHLLSDKQIIEVIANYFGCLPTIASVNLFWSFASADGVAKGPQRFHRDIDDHKTCTMFMNLTDTGKDEGAHCYIEKTHAYATLKEIFDDSKNDTLPQDLNPFQKRLTPEDFFRLPLNGYSFDKLYTHFFGDHAKYLYGQRGSVIITDNYGIHRGVPALKKDRLILWISFALTATHSMSAEVKVEKRASYADLKGQIDDSKMTRYVLRNVVNFS